MSLVVVLNEDANEVTSSVFFFSSLLRIGRRSRNLELARRPFISSVFHFGGQLEAMSAGGICFRTPI